MIIIITEIAVLSIICLYFLCCDNSRLQLHRSRVRLNVAYFARNKLKKDLTKLMHTVPTLNTHQLLKSITNPHTCAPKCVELLINTYFHMHNVK